MAKISAHGANEVGRWTKAGGDTLVLREGANGKLTLLRKWTRGASYTVLTIIVGRKANGGPVYSSNVTHEAVERYATANGYERTGVRR